MSGAAPAAAPLPSIDAERLAATVSIAAAADAIEAALAAERLPETPLRSSFPTGSGELLLMPTWGAPGVGVKLLTLEPENPTVGAPLVQGTFVLFSPRRKAPVASFDGAALTALRTAAVTVVGARALARPDSRTLLVFGAGRQAESHLEGLAEAFELREAVFVDRVPDRARRLARRASELGLDGRVGSADDLPGADIVCCCTTSSAPVLDGGRLSPGTHVAAIGAYRPDMRELDEVTLQRATVVVDSRAAAAEEAGDLIAAARGGAWSMDRVAGELRDLVRGLRRGEADEITVLKTVGEAWEDLVVAAAAAELLGVQAE